MKSKGMILVATLIAIAAILVSGGTVMAASGGHGGGGHWSGGHGWHGGHGGGHWRGGGWGWGWGWPYYGLGLATGAFLSYPYYNYPYYSPQQQSSGYVEPSPQAEEQTYWYFCPDARNYYPYVKRCPSGWLKVIPPSGEADGGE